MDANERLDNEPTPDRSQSRWEKVRWLVVGVSCGMALSAIMFAFFRNGGLHNVEHIPADAWKDFRVETDGMSLVFFRHRTTQQGLERQLQIRRQDTPNANLYLPLGSDSQTIINVYVCDVVGENKRMLLLVDKHYDMLVNLEKAEIVNDPLSVDSTKDAMAKIQQKRYLGRIDTKKSPLRFIPADEAAEKPVNRP